MNTFVRATMSSASCSELEQERDHPAVVAHLPGRDLVAGVVGEAGVEHLLDARVVGEEGDDGARVLAVLAHAHGEGLEPAEHEPRVERPGDRAERVLQEAEPLRDRLVVRRDHAGDDVGVAAEVLRRRVDHDVGAEVERVLQVRRGERVVDDDLRADRVRRLGDGGDVDDVEQRVGRALDPDEPRLLVEVGGGVRRQLLRPAPTRSR